MTDSRSRSLPWEGQPYSVKRHGMMVDACDNEPVQTPGCIQTHGALLVLRPGDLRVVQASENCGRWLGQPPEALLGTSVAFAIGADGEAQLREMLATGQLEGNPQYGCTIPARGEIPPLDLTVHTLDGVVIVECEATERSSLAPPTDGYTLLKGSLRRLQASGTLVEFCHTVTEEVRSLTHLDRVMVYKFHADGHGEVFAESRRSDLSPWLGLHYPAADIPRPAREVFKQIWIRPVPEVGAELAELVPLTNPDTGKPLTMTHCMLRGPPLGREISRH